MRFEFYHDIHSYTLSRKKRSGIIIMMSYEAVQAKHYNICVHVELVTLEILDQ